MTEGKTMKRGKQRKPRGVREGAGSFNNSQKQQQAYSEEEKRLYQKKRRGRGEAHFLTGQHLRRFSDG